MANTGSVVSGTDYNDVVNGVTAILGLGSGGDGYGQIVASKENAPTRGTTNLIDNNEWNTLRTDINKCSRHQSNADALSSAIPNNYIIGADASGPSVTRITGDNFSIDTPNAAIGVNDWVNALTQIQSQKNSIDANQRTLTTTRAFANTTRTTTWGGALQGQAIYCEIRVIFDGGYECTNSAGTRVTASGADHARHFFNSGGQIRLSQYLAGGTAKDTDWGTLLGNAGNAIFEANRTSGDGSANYRDGNTNVDGDIGGSIESALGFYQLTTGYQLIAKKNGSQAEYAENYYTLYVKRNSAYDEITFKWEFHDVDTGDQTGIGPAVDEPVLASGGEMGAGIDLLRATGSYVSVPEPSPDIVTELRLT
jgi:hypothetical protein